MTTRDFLTLSMFTNKEDLTQTSKNCSCSILQFLMKHKRSVTEEQMLALFRSVNKKANAFVDFEEFVSFLCGPKTNPQKILKQYTKKDKASEYDSVKKPIVKPVVKNLEMDRRSRSPILKHMTGQSSQTMDHSDRKPKDSLEIRKPLVRDLHTQYTQDYSDAQRPKSNRSRVQRSSNMGGEDNRKNPDLLNGVASPTAQRKNHEFLKETLTPSQNRLLSSANPVRHPSPILSMTDAKAGQAKNKNSDYLLMRRDQFKAQVQSRKASPGVSARRKSPQNSPSRNLDSEFKGTKLLDKAKRSPSSSQKYNSAHHKDFEPVLANRKGTNQVRIIEQKQAEKSNKIPSSSTTGKKSIVRVDSKPIGNLNKRMEEEGSLPNSGVASRRERPSDNQPVFKRQTRPTGSRQPDPEPPSPDRGSRDLSNSPNEAVNRRGYQSSPNYSAVDEDNRRHLSSNESSDKKRIITLDIENLENPKSKILQNTGNDKELSFSDRKPNQIFDTLEEQETPKFEEFSLKYTTSVTPHDLDAFCTVLKKIIVFYERIEELKNSIYKSASFNLFDHFRAFDFENKGHLTFNELYQLFNSFSVGLGRGDLQEYLRIMLRNPKISSNTLFSEEDLAICFSPVDPEGKLIMTGAGQRGSRKPSQFEVKKSVASQLEEVVSHQQKMHEEIREGLRSMNLLARRSLFDYLAEDSSDSKKIHWQDIVSFLRTHGVTFFEEDLMFVFREFNTNSPKQLDLPEFLAFFKTYTSN